MGAIKTIQSTGAFHSVIQNIIKQHQISNHS